MRRRATGKPDGNQAEIVRVLRGVGATVADTGGVGGGFPDLVVGYRGVTYLIEVKDRTGLGKIGLAQKLWQSAWKGGNLAVVWGPEEALRVLDIESHHPYSQGAS